jgi:hypothetical protein
VSTSLAKAYGCDHATIDVVMSSILLSNFILFPWFALRQVGGKDNFRISLRSGIQGACEGKNLVLFFCL